MNERYEVQELLGDGTFGRVLLAEDTKKRRPVAIKVIRDVEKYTRNAIREAEILKDCVEMDEETQSCIRIWHSPGQPHPPVCCFRDAMYP